MGSGIASQGALSEITFMCNPVKVSSSSPWSFMSLVRVRERTEGEGRRGGYRRGEVNLALCRIKVDRTIQKIITYKTILT